MKKLILFTFLTVMMGSYSFSDGAWAFCSCWDGVGPVKSEANPRGTTCGAGLNYDSGWFNLEACKQWCEKTVNTSIYNNSYVDQPAFNKCRDQKPPTKIVEVSAANREAIEQIQRDGNRSTKDKLLGSLLLILSFGQISQ